MPQVIIPDGMHGCQHQDAVGQQCYLRKEAGCTQRMMKSIVYLPEACEEEEKREWQRKEVMMSAGQQAGDDEPG
jgi:hypothetical protein